MLTFPFPSQVFYVKEAASTSQARAVYMKPLQAANDASSCFPWTEREPKTREGNIFAHD